MKICARILVGVALIVCAVLIVLVAIVWQGLGQILHVLALIGSVFIKLIQ